MKSEIPIVLFAYNRTDTLRHTLECLKENNVPLIYAFSDGPRVPEIAPAVANVREILHTIDWCEIIICERDTNLGLGRSILAGVTEVLQKHASAIIFEDDLICVPGTYQYLCTALEYYQNDSRVMSVTGWTHPMTTPSDITVQPYFDGRAECWVWGTWARAWNGMLDHDAISLIKKSETEGIDVYKYGSDLVDMAKSEFKTNIWAVRFLYWHILHHGLCLRPPWSMVEHIGFNEDATNTKSEETWLKNPPLRASPPLPKVWPTPDEHPECSELWQKMLGKQPKIINESESFLYYQLKHFLIRIYHLVR